MTKTDKQLLIEANELLRTCSDIIKRGPVSIQLNAALKELKEALKQKECSYCNKDLGKGAKYSFFSHGKPTIYQCKRRWCKFLIWIGLYKAE